MLRPQRKTANALSTKAPILVCLSLLALTPLSRAQEWTRFRGPNGSGISEAKTVPTRWTENDYNWVVELPGVGHSSPVIWRDRLFVTSADDAGQRHVLCMNTSDGTQAWQKTFELLASRKHKNNSHASSTPAVGEDHVYVLWQSKQSSPLVALDHQGNEVWRYDLGPYLHGQGGATSPIVHEDLVIVCNDHKQGSFLLAVDRRSGQEIWKTPRDGKRACYATPCVYQPKDRPEEIIFSHCFEGITGVDPATGGQNWKITPFGTFKQRAVGSPIVVGDFVVANSGFGGTDKNVVAVRPQKTAGGIEVDELYRVTSTVAPHVPTTIAYGDWVFLWGDSGIVTCIKAATGKRLWHKRVGGNYFSSPICIDGRLYGVELNGTVVVLAASDKFQELARNPLGNPSRATPAVSGGTLYLRTYSHLYSIGGKKL